jgi:DNA-binding winged helix-turn-helix (wHTH) protein/Tol biopolymer transport system component
MRAAQSSPDPDPGPAPAIPARQPSLVFGPFSFDPASRILSRDGQEMPLPPRVTGVLQLLLERAGQVVPRQELIDSVWKEAFVTDTSLAEAVSVLRQALSDDPQTPTYVQTLHRRGYRFVAPVSSTQSGTGDPQVTNARPSAVSPSIGRELVPWSIAVICAIAAASAVWQYIRRAPETDPIVTRFSIQLPAGMTFDEQAPSLAFSPNGAMLAWSACDPDGCRIFARGLDQIEAVRVAGTEDGRSPFFSPDGRWLAFFANGRLSKVALEGGSPITIADAPTPLGGVWIDREIVFAGAPTGGLMRVSSDGGEPHPLTTPNESSGEVRHAWPALVPGTRILLFIVDSTPAVDAPGPPGVLAAVPFNPRGADRSPPPRAAQWRTLIDNVSVARAAAADTIVFARESELHAVAFDAARLALAGTPRAIRGQLATARGRAHFALSTSGSLVHAVAPEYGNRTVVFFETRATDSQSARLNFAMREAAIAPDGARIAGVNLLGTGSGIWISDTDRLNATRLVHKGINASPVWSADGSVVFYASRDGGAFEIWRRDVGGNRPPARIWSSDRHAFPLAASPDGTLLAFLQRSEGTRSDIWLLPLQGGAPRPLVQTPFDEGAASFSPDSSLLAFQSAETGRWEIYVQRLRDGRRTLVSTAGGERPSWSGGGLYYQSNRQVVRKTIDGQGTEIRVVDGADGAALSTTRLDSRTTFQGASADGKLLLSRGSEPPPSSTIVSLEWLREVRTLLGPPASPLPR